MNKEQFVKDCLLVRSQSPLVHNITNYVAMNFAANSLLAVGASPLMSFCPEEMDDIVRIASALTINIGCLDLHEIEGMKLAAKAAAKYGKPWVLDPVGAGASQLRTQTCKELIELHPAIIRGNASEIACLAGVCATESRGVDSSMNSNDVAEAAKTLAKSTGAVVSMSGATDYVTDGERVEILNNGDPIMSRVTVMGCSASCVTGAFAAVNPDAFEAALHAMALWGVAGEVAAKQSNGATGTFAVKFMDELSTYNAEEYAKLIRQ